MVEAKSSISVGEFTEGLVGKLKDPRLNLAKSGLASPSILGGPTLSSTELLALELVVTQIKTLGTLSRIL